MKRSIKNRIAAALLLATSFGGHNYKAVANYYVDSRNIKNDKKSSSFPLLAKIGIPVGSLALLIGGINKLRPTRANISLNDVGKNVDGFINEQEIKRKKKNAQAREEQIRQYKQEDKETLECNYQFLTKNAGNNPTKMSCVQNLKKLADSFFENYHNKLINDDLTCNEMLESKYKYLKYPFNVNDNGKYFDDNAKETITFSDIKYTEKYITFSDIKYHEFDNEHLITREEQENMENQNECLGLYDFLMTSKYKYCIKSHPYLLKEQNSVLNNLLCGFNEIGNDDNLYNYEINDDGSLSVSLKSDNELKNKKGIVLDKYVKFNSVKISLDCDNKELKVVWNGKCVKEMHTVEYKEMNNKNNKNNKDDQKVIDKYMNVEIISIFDVSEWIK